MELTRVLMRSTDFLGAGLVPDCGCGRRSGPPVDLIEHGEKTTFAHRHGGDDRNARFSGQTLDVDVNTLALGDVIHVVGQHHRSSGLAQLEQEGQHRFEVGGVRNADDDIGDNLAGQPSQHKIPGACLIGIAHA